MNPGGSIKDRIANRIIQDYEKEGIVKNNSTLIEATSGNTGVGLSMVCASKQLGCIITMPEKMSKEKETTINSLGAKVIRTPTEADSFSEVGHIGLALKIKSENKNIVYLNQYDASGNMNAHRDCTAVEIFKQMDENVD